MSGGALPVRQIGLGEDVGAPRILRSAGRERAFVGPDRQGGDGPAGAIEGDEIQAAMRGLVLLLGDASQAVGRGGIGGIGLDRRRSGGGGGGSGR